MAGKSRASVVALTRLLARRFPELDDPAQAVADGRVLVDGRTIDNPRSRVRNDASIRLLTPRPLRGQAKLGAALDAFGLDVAGVIAVDAGAAAGGFTTALLERGVARVYAVDAGFGQLESYLRRDPRVVNLERTNVADLDQVLVPDIVELVTMDLSYLSVAAAVHAIARMRYAPHASLVALVKPTFELRAGTVVTDPASVRAAIRSAIAAIDAAGWRALACSLPAVSGAGGAVEAFVLARRRVSAGLPWFR